MVGVPKGRKVNRIKGDKPKSDIEHRDNLRAKCCDLCGSRNGVTWHHLLRIKREYLLDYPQFHGRSMAKKPHDAWTMALCIDCHGAGKMGVHGPLGEDRVIMMLKPDMVREEVCLAHWVDTELGRAE
jgi:hypothetical protein